MDINVQIVAGGLQELRRIAADGNHVATVWVERIEQVGTILAQLYQLGEMRVTLMRDPAPEAQALLHEMWPEPASGEE